MSAEPCCSPSEHPKAMKNRLFCPDCGHTSPTTGDWVLHVHEFRDDSWLAYRCPDCERIVTRRPLPDQDV
ncbi:hypothetical protein ACLI4Z_18865 [Natrialbaceae archaeon A-arb3/5]